MEVEIRQLVQKLHDSPGRVMLVTAGAGTQALAWLLGVAGASRTLLEALVPYEGAAFCDFLGREPEQHVARQTAGLLAGRAVNRACRLYPGPEPVIGLACTATIVTDRPKRGPHRAHVAAWSADQMSWHSLHLCKGARDRDGEENVVSRLVMNVLAQVYDIGERLSLPLVDGDQYHSGQSDLSLATVRLYRGEISTFGVQADGQFLPQDYRPKAILSGSFNPLHKGHLDLAQAAGEILGELVTFELAAVNADKETISPTETLQRLLQFAGQDPVLVSNAPVFVHKARLYPGATFVVGYDTAERVLLSRFYDDSRENVLSALAEIRAHDCHFLVAGRVGRDGVFHEAGELVVPEPFRDLFKPIPADRFRLDVSSTELRKSRYRQ